MPSTICFQQLSFRSCPQGPQAGHLKVIPAPVDLVGNPSNPGPEELTFMTVAPFTQPDLPIGRALPPLNSQQCSGHCQSITRRSLWSLP
jgi:hypothetical protein